MPRQPEGVLPALPGGVPLLLRALFKRSGSAGPTPTSEFLAPDLAPATLAGYNALFGFVPDALPLAYYYPLVQRAHLATMLSPAFPFRLLGMIHAENALQEERRPDLQAPLLIATETGIEAPTAQGAQYCTLKSRAVQEGVTVFTCTSRYLAKRARQPRDGAPRTLEEETMPALAAWNLERDTGRRYAAVSGDWNPIHLWPWSARLLGLPSPIIHGMHTVAAACAQLERAAAGRVTALSARFKAPIALGSRVQMHADVAAGLYRVRCGERLAVDGTFTLTKRSQS